MDLTARVEEIHTRSRGTYGTPRIHAELAEAGVAVSRKRVARVMRAAGISGVSRRRGPRTTRRDVQARPAPDRVERHFEADGPNRLWVADITYVPTLVGFLYLAIVLDVFSRRVVGWAMATHLRTELVTEALEMAVAQRRPEAVVHHSDQGCQYTSLAFGARCRKWGVALSMGSVGDCFDLGYPFNRSQGRSSGHGSPSWPRARSPGCSKSPTPANRRATSSSLPPESLANTTAGARATRRRRSVSFTARPREQRHWELRLHGYPRFR